MWGCERAGSVPRAPPPPAPGASRRLPPGHGGLTSGHGGLTSGHGGLTSGHGGLTSGHGGLTSGHKLHGGRAPARHASAEFSLAHSGEHVLLRRKRRRSRVHSLRPAHSLAPPLHSLEYVQRLGSDSKHCVGCQERLAVTDEELCVVTRDTISGECGVCAGSRSARGVRGAAWGLLALLLLVMVRSAACGEGALGAGVVCARAAGLTERQRALCRAHPANMPAIAAGLRLAWSECELQLAGRRWNCSAVARHNHFAHVVPLATREAAYTYALASAGVTYALSAACARGDLPACGCAHRRRAEWEGAGEGAGRCGDAAYGARVARRFLDARELERDPRALMNLHNNRLGRKMVKELVRVECKCHGVSGSCSVRTCWRALPPFRHVARALTDKYSRARLVSAARAPGRAGLQLLVNKARGGGRAARRSELVFLAASPSYCELTPGRRCNASLAGPGGCGALCCGRGQRPQRALQRVQCRCSFHWCCRVSCDTCLRTDHYHVCN